MLQKFPFSRIDGVHSENGGAGKEKNPAHPMMFKIFLDTTFHVTHQQGGGVDNNHVFWKLQWQELIFHNNFQC